MVISGNKMIFDFIFMSFLIVTIRLRENKLRRAIGIIINFNIDLYLRHLYELYIIKSNFRKY